MRRLAIVVLGVVAACGAQAQMYKWIDENGRVQYTQTPPPPGTQAQQIKPPASQSARKPGSAARMPEARQQPAGKGKPGAAKGRDKDEDIQPDARRMLGEWRTHPGARVQVRFQLQQGAGSSLTSGQVWTVGGDSHATSDMKVVVSGADGAGTLSQDTSEKLPSTLGYELRGGALILTVDTGPYAGTHLLTRSR
jgi:hypothetical protein